ncbi:MAG: CDP-alcohol phosphatidyltransferase family protein [Deltaproteobacteria bacterium]|nr:MAG: CDP-alcohol phosphatidyltransferase family protein [Deltaproteobacteria bacterium]
MTRGSRPAAAETVENAVPYPPLPPFSSLLKSRDVEDPVNIWMHRPLAYAFVAAIYRTPMTPNMVTLLAMLTGLVAGAMILVGTGAALVLGGILLWTAAILDGADGFLARAKGTSSQFGRALDGAADAVVAIATVFPAVYHLWVTQHNPVHLWLAVPVIYLAVQHLVIYDYYKETYLRQTRLERGGEGDDAEVLEKADLSGKSWLTRFVVQQMMIPYVKAGERLVRWTNPLAKRGGLSHKRTEETAAIYRKHNHGPMQLWALISLAPHTYLMAICIMFDRIDVYLWFRLVGANVILAVAVIWQRIATIRTVDEIAQLRGRRPRASLEVVTEEARG